MKILLAILILVGVGFVGWKLWQKWEQTSREEELGAGQPTQIDQRSLPGMDGRLERSLEEARKGGAKGLKNFLDQHRGSPLLRDPRLAAIELDYAVLLLASQKRLEAAKVYASVKERVPADSPVYPRVQQLQKTFE